MFEKITEQELEVRGVGNVSTTPTKKTPFGESGFNAKQLKERFDLLPRYIAERLNEVFDGLENGDLVNFAKFGTGRTVGEVLSGLDDGSEARNIYIETPIETLTLAEAVTRLVKLLNEIENGEIGKNGITPHIGENGNWFIGDLDTEVKAGGVEEDYIAENYLPLMQRIQEALRAEAEANGGNINEANNWDRAYIRRKDGKDAFVPFSVDVTRLPRGIWEIGEGDYSIPLRHPDGRMSVAAPSYDDDAVPRGYADRHYASSTEIDRVESIAKGAQQALSFYDYKTMITELLEWEYGNRKKIGQSIYIQTLNVPDLWVSDALNDPLYDSEDYRDYVYTSDKDFVRELTENGYVRIGAISVSALETGKVALENYYDKVEIDGMIGDIGSALDALHQYAQTFISGGET